MFVQILREDGHSLILNIEHISSLSFDYVIQRLVVNMSNGDVFYLTQEQYNELCEILTKKL